MSRILTAAAYALHNMPIGTTFDAPVLTDDEAYDVAGYIVSQKQPIDTPYGPYADDFSGEQHKFGADRSLFLNQYCSLRCAK